MLSRQASSGGLAARTIEAMEEWAEESRLDFCNDLSFALCGRMTAENQSCKDNVTAKRIPIIVDMQTIGNSINAQHDETEDMYIHRCFHIHRNRRGKVCECR